MTLNFKPLLFLSILSLTNDLVLGQKQLKEKTEIAYRLNNQDSVVRFQKTTSYDKQGRIITKQNYYYSPTKKGILVKEEKVYFDANQQVLTEQIIAYAVGEEPKTTKLITKYLDYANKEKDSKRIWRQLYDDYGEMTKEDTLTYDANQRLIERCNYDYRNNTSLFCHYHSYNKKGLPILWRTYSKWTTINGKGDVVQRQAKRRNYRYRYNKKGQHVGTRGRYYLNRFSQCIKYDKNGKILEDKTLLKRKVRKASNKKKPKKKKITINKEVQIQSYQEGRMIRDAKFVNKVELENTEISYQDTLLQSIKVSQKGLAKEETGFSYNKRGVLTKKTVKKYSSKGVFRYTLSTFFNAAGKPIKEEQRNEKKTLSVLEIEYDAEGNPILQSLSTNNNKTFEKTMYIYTYY